MYELLGQMGNLPYSSETGQNPLNLQPVIARWNCGPSILEFLKILMRKSVSLCEIFQIFCNGEK